MTQFAPFGPFKISISKKSGGRTISDANIVSFWNEHRSFAQRIGCYVFAMRAGKGYTPIYIGKATKSFGSEVFAPHKHAKYLQALTSYKRGTPVIFLIAYPSYKKGAINKNHLSVLEKFLIQQAVIVNSNLLNINLTKIPKWGIAGIIRSTTKKPNKSATQLKRVMGFSG
jgi:hypothetical protein